jgi:shikimate kinase
VVRSRLAADPMTAVRRPGLCGNDPLAEVDQTIAVREPLYREVADVAFDTGAEPAERIVDRIVEWLASRSRHGASPEQTS